MIRDKIISRAKKVYGCDMPSCRSTLRDEIYFPRGLFYLGNCPPKLIVIDCKPGKLYSTLGEKRWDSYEEACLWERDCFGSIQGGNQVRYHKRLLMYLEYIVNSHRLSYSDVERDRSQLTDDLFSQVYRTNIVKCSSCYNPSKLSPDMRNCVENHLSKELAYCKHRPVLCLGTNTYECFKEYVRDYPNTVVKIPNPLSRQPMEDIFDELEQARMKLNL